MKKKRRNRFSLSGCALKLAAGIVFVMALVGLAGWLAVQVLPAAWQSPWVVGLLCAAAMILGMEAATVLLSPGQTTPFRILGPKARDFSPEHLRRTGMLVEETYQARRAFEVEEISDEGLHYYVELADGRVMYFEGQYLYDFTEDPEESLPRRFPCTDFTVQRHAGKVDFFNIICRGSAIAPEVTTPPFMGYEYREGLIPENGELIDDERYEAIKKRRLAAVQK